MTLEEIRLVKARLEKELFGLVDEFERETKVNVSCLVIARHLDKVIIEAKI